MANNKGVGGHGGGETTQSVVCLHQELEEIDVHLGLQRRKSPELPGQRGYSTSFRFNKRHYLKSKVDRAS